MTGVEAGSLQDVGLPALVRPLVLGRRTGPLRFTRGRIVKTIYLSEGRLIFATSTDPDDRLGEMLLRKGLITFRALEESVRAIQAGKRQGTILVESGAIKSRDLVGGVMEQVQEIIYSLFRAEDGEYEFVEGDLPSREVIVLRMSTADILMEGIRRISSWGRIRAAVGGLDQRYTLTGRYPEIVESMTLHKDELNLVASIDEVMTVDEICSAAPQSDFLVCRSLWGLWTAGVLDKVPEHESRTEDASRDQTVPHTDVRGASVGQEIERFNELHRFVYELVSYELRENAGSFLERAFVRASVEHAELFDGVAVDSGGELDSIALRRNITAGEIARYVQGLDRLLDIEVELAREALGEKKAAIVRDGLQALRDHQAEAPGLSQR